MAKMFMKSININKAENGVIVRLELESEGIGTTIDFESEEHVFEKIEDAVSFIEEKVKVLIKKGD